MTSRPLAPTMRPQPAGPGAPAATTASARPVALTSTFGPDRRRRPAAGRLVTPLAAAAVAVVALCSLALAAGAGGPASAAPLVATSGCRAVGGGAVSSPGPHRATVVVDTGSGAVWSACISFSGTITGIDALEAAKAQITDLSPVYDVYAGEGRAVCRLRGVGNDPPDCLGKSAAYWEYFHDGRYARGCACTTTVADGDVEGWRWASGSGTPRPATDGYEATAAAPPPATTTVPSGSVTTTRPASSGSGGSGGSGGLHVGPGGVTQPPPSAGSHSASTTTMPGAGGTTTPVGASSTTTPGGAATSGTTQPDGVRGRDPKAAEHATSRRSTAADPGRPLPTIPAAARHDGSSSGATSALGFAAALAVAAAIGITLRHRRRTPA